MKPNSFTLMKRAVKTLVNKISKIENKFTESTSQKGVLKILQLLWWLLAPEANNQDVLALPRSP